VPVADGTDPSEPSDGFDVAASELGAGADRGTATGGEREGEPVV
jgi:hypothetical protein